MGSLEVSRNFASLTVDHVTMLVAGSSIAFPKVCRLSTGDGAPSEEGHFPRYFGTSAFMTAIIYIPTFESAVWLVYTHIVHRMIK